MRFPMILAALLTIGGMSAAPAAAETTLGKPATATVAAPGATETVSQYRNRGRYGYRGAYGGRGWTGYRGTRFRGYGYRPTYRYAYRPRYDGYNNRHRGHNRGYNRGWRRR